VLDRFPAGPVEFVRPLVPVQVVLGERVDGQVDGGGDIAHVDL
jgi:hypothetical protein